MARQRYQPKHLAPKKTKSRLHFYGGRRQRRFYLIVLVFSVTVVGVLCNMATRALDVTTLQGDVALTTPEQLVITLPTQPIIEESSVVVEQINEERPELITLEHYSEVIATTVAEEERTPESACIEEEKDPEPAYTDEELLFLAKVMQAECGSDWLSDRHQLLVGNVFLNRVESPEFPNTMAEVFYQVDPIQYSTAYSSRIDFENLVPSKRTIENARRLMDGERFCPPSVVFQANFPQGSGVFEFIEDDILDPSYFCYSNFPEQYPD